MVLIFSLFFYGTTAEVGSKNTSVSLSLFQQDGMTMTSKHGDIVNVCPEGFGTFGNVPKERVSMPKSVTLRFGMMFG